MSEGLRKFGRFAGKAGKEALIWGGLMGVPVVAMEGTDAALPELYENDGTYETAFAYDDPATYIGLVALAAIVRTIIHRARMKAWDDGECYYYREDTNKPKW